MPRQSRLDAPGLLQHVMARGIERRDIFKDDKDRESFLDRLAIVLEETQTQCYAWALIPNHFHLFLRTGPTSLSKVMRRLMTGYAVTFNKRHKRSGHLFQNRYKSIICEEDPYLLELIRYIHLNPLRAKLVQDLKELDKYPWTGHSAILGHRQNALIPEASNQRPEVRQQNTPLASLGPSRFNDKFLAEKTIEDVLLHFGEKLIPIFVFMGQSAKTAARSSIPPRKYVLNAAQERILQSLDFRKRANSLPTLPIIRHGPRICPLLLP